MTTKEMYGVTEYGEGMSVELTQTDGMGRWVVKAKNESGYNCTEVDILELVSWLKANRPDLIA